MNAATAYAACRGVLLDLDGTLVATEELHIALHHEVLLAQGLTFDALAEAASIGLGDDRTVYRAIATRAGRIVTDAEIQGWVAAKNQLTHHRFATAAIGTRPGAVSLLTDLGGRGRPHGVVTSTHRDLLGTVLRQAGLAPLVPWAIAGDEVPARKPDPRPYLMGAARLGLAPGHCLVIEDSVPGVTAARAAGCPVFALRGTTPDAALVGAGASGLVDSLEELLP